MNNYKEVLEKNLNDPSKPWTPAFAYLETKVGIKRVYILLIFMVFLGLYLIFGYAAQLVCNTVGFLYPAYASMKAIESPSKGDDTKWLTYWTVFAFFSIVEYPSDLLLYWFPFYWLLKCIFLTWLFAPIEFNGSIFLYNSFIRPRFLKHQGEVDNVISKVAGSVSKTLFETAADMKKE